MKLLNTLDHGLSQLTKAKGQSRNIQTYRLQTLKSQFDSKFIKQVEK